MNLASARFISFILNPLVVIIFLPFVLVYQSTGDVLSAVHWTGYTFIFLLIISSYVLFMVRKGKFTDYDVSKREQRPLLFLIALILAAFYLLGLFLFDAPSVLFIVTFGVILGIFLASILNNWIKASIHVATIAAILVGLAITYGGWYYLLLLFIPVVAYVRVRAKRHTVAETIAGAFFGGALSLFTYIMVTLL